jgi:hypothetical protein
MWFAVKNQLAWNVFSLLAGTTTAPATNSIIAIEFTLRELICRASQPPKQIPKVMPLLAPPESVGNLKETKLSVNPSVCSQKKSSRPVLSSDRL